MVQNRLSSRKTFFFKKVLPPLLIVWSIFVFFLGLFGKISTSDIFYIELIFPCVMAITMGIIIYLFFRKFADQVLGYKDYLLVVRGGNQVHIPFSSIMNVNLSPTIVGIPVITLLLSKSTKFGSRIVFLPVVKFGLSVNNKNIVAEELIRCAYEARSGIKI